MRISDGSSDVCSSDLKRKWVWAAVCALATGAMASSASARDGEMAHHKGHHQWSQASLQAQASAVVTQDMVRITLASELTGTSQTAVAQDLKIGSASCRERVCQYV